MLLRLRNLNQLSLVVRHIHQSAVRLKNEAAPVEISGSVSTKFQVFRNESGIIFDIEEERKLRDANISIEETKDISSAYDGINLKRKNDSILLVIVTLTYFSCFRRRQWSF